jgi:hypothetical protein
MEESAGQTTDDFEAKTLPDAHCALIGRHNEVELHGAETAFAGAFQGMRAHQSRDAAAGGLTRRHIATISCVRSAALLVSPEIVSADKAAGILDNEDFVSGREPVVERLSLGEIAGQGIGLPGADGGFEDAPDGVAVRLDCRTHGHV